MRHLLAGIVLFTCWPLFAQKPSVGVDRVVVYKSERKLVLLSQGKEVRSYKVALGSEPVGPKTRHGDHRTPVSAPLPEIVLPTITLLLRFWPGAWLCIASPGRPL